MAHKTSSIESLITQRKLHAADRIIAKKACYIAGYLGEEITSIYCEEEHDRDTTQVFPAHWKTDCRYVIENLRIEGQIIKDRGGYVDALSGPLEITYQKKLVFKGRHVEKWKGVWEEDDLSDIEDSIELYLPGDTTWEPELDFLYAQAMRKEQRLQRDERKNAREEERRRIDNLRKKWKV